MFLASAQEDTTALLALASQSLARLDPINHRQDNLYVWTALKEATVETQDWRQSRDLATQATIAESTLSMPSQMTMSWVTNAQKATTVSQDSSSLAWEEPTPQSLDLLSVTLAHQGTSAMIQMELRSQKSAHHSTTALLDQLIQPFAQPDTTPTEIWSISKK